MNFKIHQVKVKRLCEYLEFIPERMAYVKNGRKKDIQYYSCKESNCEVSGKVVDNVFLKINNRDGSEKQHNHPDHKTFLEVLDTKYEIKVQALQTSDSFENIFEKGILG